MTQPAPGGAATLNRTPAPDRATNPKSTGSPCPFCPDVMAVARVLGITRRRGLDHLQQLYDRLEGGHDFLAYLMTYLDPTGEAATYRADAPAGARRRTR